MFDGVMPKVPDHVGKFVILLEPLKTDGIGLAYIAGVCPAWIKVPENGSDFKYTEIQDGDASALIAGDTGSTQILWIDPDITPGDCGWAIVRLASSAAGDNTVVVKITNDRLKWDGTTPLGTGQYRGRILSGSTEYPDKFPGDMTLPGVTMLTCSILWSRGAVI